MHVSALWHERFPVYPFRSKHTITLLAAHTKAMTILRKKKPVEIHRLNAKWKTSVVIQTTHSPPNIVSYVRMFAYKKRKEKESKRQITLHQSWCVYNLTDGKCKSTINSTAYTAVRLKSSRFHGIDTEPINTCTKYDDRPFI